MIEIDEKVIAKRVGSLRYLEAGRIDDPKCPAIVFLHGNSFSADVFEKQLLSSTLSEFRLLAFDLPGHGQSKPLVADQTYCFSSMARMIEQGIADLGLESVVLAGWSLGGHIALELAENVECVRGTMIFGAPPMRRGALSTIRAFHFSRDMFLASKPVFSTSDAMRFERFCLGSSADGRFCQTMMNIAPNLRSELSKSVIQGKNADQLEQVLNAKKLICMLQGANDSLVRTSYIEDVARNPEFRGEICVIEDAGHAPFLDQSGTFDHMLANFARRSIEHERGTETAEVKAA